MKLINNILYLDFSEMIECNFSSRTLKSWKPPIKISDAIDRRAKLFNYDLLNQKYKSKIVDRFGNPYEYISYTLIKHCLNTDLNTLKKVTEFKTSLRDHVLPNGTGLPESLYKGSHDKRGIYVEACVLLHWLNSVDAKKVKKLGFDSIKTVYKAASNYIDAEKLDLPKSYNRLRMKIREFAESGYLAVINKKYGNDNGKKVGKGKLSDYQTSLLVTLLRQHNNFDFEQVRKLYNQEAIAKGFKVIESKNTVLNFFREHIAKIMKDRKDKDIISMQTRRSKPSTPFYYVTADAWVVELPYQETKVVKSGKKKGRVETTYHKRLYLYVVLDPFNNYPVGFSIGKSETEAMTIDAFKNAIDHVHKITGQCYKPWQIQIDNFLSKSLAGFFKSICNYYTPAAVGNAKSKIVERYFKYLNKNYCQYQANWSGFNLNSTNKNQPNSKAQNKFKKKYPTESEVRDFIIKMMYTEREIKQQEWLETFNDGNEFDRIEYLEVFGVKKPDTNRIHEAVFSPTINGQTIEYDTFDERFKEKYIKDWITYYDPADLSSILVTADDGRYKFILERKHIQPMALKDRQNDDGLRLQDVYNYNDYVNDLIKRRNEAHERVVSEVFDESDDVTTAHTIIKQSFTVNGSHKKHQAPALSQAKIQKESVKIAKKLANRELLEAEQSRAEYLKGKQLPNIFNNE
ncbi:hypothetical protein KORDIASMS9_02705 [Kordia sp. SMS9]|uniref:hypothetical protein n=1 Tax=Kordia sp. SMS9 TaxID=2282170 RepID=UPI000E0D6CAD|nr:hypothetical protein [Kordia sp. SMS9]AXG70465.1 hypothetical protein KORDIASMS9_02705 [Kordia sp. SMS9]